MIFVLAGIGAGAAIAFTRKSGPFHLFDWLAKTGLILFYCSLCSSVWVILLARCLYAIVTREWSSYETLVTIAYDAAAGFGWSLLILGITGTLDIDFNARKKA